MSGSSGTDFYVEGGEIQWGRVVSTTMSAMVLFVAGGLAAMAERSYTYASYVASGVYGLAGSLIRRPLELQTTLTEESWQAAATELTSFGFLAFLAALVLIAVYWRTIGEFLTSLQGEI